MVPAAGMWLVHFNPPRSKIHAEVNGLIGGVNTLCLLIKVEAGEGLGRRRKKKEETKQGVIRPRDKVTFIPSETSN